VQRESAEGRTPRDSGERVDDREYGPTSELSTRSIAAQTEARRKNGRKSADSMSLTIDRRARPALIQVKRGSEKVHTVCT
jgi:hypothetical protein